MWSEDFLVLGESRLVDLKDKIGCFRNDIRIGEFSADPDQVKQAPIMREVITSGFFLIENTVYNDMRAPDATDCSVPLIEWARNRPKIGPFDTKRMEDTKFIDLSIRLGFPYLYTHLGNCEHLIVFTSVK